MSVTSNFLNFFFYIFPAIFFTTSAYLNAYIFFFIAYSLFFFYFNKIKINITILDFLIILFFLISITSTLLNINTTGSFMLFKSVLDLRFAILFFVIRNLIDQKIVNIKIFCN